MGCRCNERRDAIMKAAVALAHGDSSKVSVAARFVRDTAIEDASEAARKMRAAAAARLGIRRR